MTEEQQKQYDADELEFSQYVKCAECQVRMPEADLFHHPAIGKICLPDLVKYVLADIGEDGESVFEDYRVKLTNDPWAKHFGYRYEADNAEPDGNVMMFSSDLEDIIMQVLQRRNLI